MRAVHENVRKHRCEFCEFTSFASSALKRHILAIHEKRKPFECDKVSHLKISAAAIPFLEMTTIRFDEIFYPIFSLLVFVQKFLQRIIGASSCQ